MVYTDKALLERLSKGDGIAYEAIYRRYVHALYAAALKRLNDRQQAEDLVQDIFFRIWKKKEQMAKVGYLPAYLHTAVRYEVLKRMTRHKAPLCFFEPFESVLMESDNPENRLMAKDLLDLIYKYAAILPEKRRQIFLLHLTYRLSTREIAEELKISQKTVQNQLGTALNGLRAHVGPAVMIMAAVLL